jgi:hypothetical protein
METLGIKRQLIARHESCSDVVHDTALAGEDTRSLAFGTSSFPYRAADRKGYSLTARLQIIELDMLLRVWRTLACRTVV